MEIRQQKLGIDLKQNKKIGIYLAAQPNAGGIFQYATSLLDALNFISDNYQIVCFIENELWKEYIPSHFTIIEIPKGKIKKGIGRMVRKISSSYRNKKAHLFDNAIRSINSENCDYTIFPSQDRLSYQVQVKTIGTIHDLMHIYESHFSEYTTEECKERDLHYSNMCENTSGILVDSTLGKQHVLDAYKMDEKRLFSLPFVPPFFLTKCDYVDVWKKYDLSKNFIFYPAQFWEHKNHVNLIRAISILKKRGLVIETVLIGSKKNHFEQVQRQIQEENLESNIKVLGYVSNDEIYSFYKTATAMVFASACGPTNIPPMEAMILECPLIVSNAYAMPEQVGDGAVLFDPYNPEEIADQIELVLSDEKLRQKMIEKGKIKVNSWNQELFNQELEKIIENLYQIDA